jgi:hypothetical protein
MFGLDSIDLRYGTVASSMNTIMDFPVYKMNNFLTPSNYQLLKKVYSVE